MTTGITPTEATAMPVAASTSEVPASIHNLNQELEVLRTQIDGMPCVPDDIDGVVELAEWNAKQAELAVEEASAYLKCERALLERALVLQAKLKATQSAS